MADYPTKSSVVVTRFGAESAIARPARVAATFPQGTDPAQDRVDLLVSSLWQLVQTLDPPDPHGTPRAHVRRDEVAADPAKWLDVLASARVEAAFPYPSSPRWDGVGGGRRLAEDGTPGIPGGWLSWLLSGSAGAAGGSDTDDALADAGLRIITLALGRVARRYPQWWRIYRAYVGADDQTRVASVAAVARAVGVAPSTARRAVARVRAAVLEDVAFMSGFIDRDDRDATLATLDMLHHSMLGRADNAGESRQDGQDGIVRRARV